MRWRGHIERLQMAESITETVNRPKRQRKTMKAVTENKRLETGSSGRKL